VTGAVAGEERLDSTVEETSRLCPLGTAGWIQDELEAAAAEEGATAIRMPSGAAHDAMIIGRHVPAGMLFVTSRDGLSHNPAEYTSIEDCERGARVLTRAIRRMAG
jgi:allantoate deiminase